MTIKMTTHPVKLSLSFADDVASLADLALYDQAKLEGIFNQTLAVMHHKRQEGVFFPYFCCDDVGLEDWIHLPKSLDIYICGTEEGRELNLDARAKDYATNILSYPSGLPDDVCLMMHEVPLGELVICHEVIIKESHEQGKAAEHHLTHLVVHGILHLLGFDHELGQEEQEEMESFEIQILAMLGISNPYE